MDNFLERLGVTNLVIYGGLVLGILLLVFLPARRRPGDNDPKTGA